MDKLPVSVMVANGDEFSRKAVGKVIEDALRSQGFENVHFTRNPNDHTTMLDAVAALVPGHFQAGVDIAAYEGYTYKPTPETELWIQRIGKDAAMSILHSIPPMDSPVGKVLASELQAVFDSATLDEFERAQGAEDIANKGVVKYHESLRELFRADGPIAALEIANAALREAETGVQIKELVLDNDVIVKRF